MSTIMIPLIGTFFILLLNRFSNYRETVTLNTSILLFAAVYKIFICVMDGDLQDPPEIISKFIDKIKEGYDVVYGIRS